MEWNDEPEVLSQETRAHRIAAGCGLGAVKFGGNEARN